MGLIKAIAGAAGGVMADQWREFFYCESMSSDVLMTKGVKRETRRGSNNKGDSNIISNGSIIAINEGQCMIILEQGKIVDFCAEPGEYVYDMSSEPSLFYGDLMTGIRDTFKQIGKRFTFGGEAGKDQRVYYFNKKEIMGNKYGTPTPVPFRVIDANIGLDIDISIRCHGEYSYMIADPLKFYANVTGNAEEEFRREQIDSQLKSELMTALQPALAKISTMGIRYSALPGHTMELADALNQVLGGKWMEIRGIKIVSFGVSSVKANEEDEAMIKQLQRTAVMRNPGMAAAHLASSQGDAMVGAANNENAGSFAAFAGLNMAQQAGGMQASQLFNMAAAQQQQQTQPFGQQQPQAAGQPPQVTQQQQTAPAVNQAARPSWSCSCGTSNKGAFCSDCGTAKPADGWVCGCGSVNKGRFCQECGKPKPAEAAVYACDKCGWEPEDRHNPPKFCPECGDIFDEQDKR